MLYQQLDFTDIDLITQNLRLFFEKYQNHPTMTRQQVSKQDLYNQIPSLGQQLEQRNWNLDTAGLFCTPGNASLPVHIDGGILYPKFWALNWPVFNCEDSYMKWYRLPEGYNLTRSNAGDYGKDIAFNLTQIEDEYELDRCVIKVPTCVRIDVPHQVVNNSTSSRILLSMRFHNLQDWKT